MTERAVIHGAVTKIDNSVGEDLIDSFINEKEQTPTTNSWLSSNVEGNIVELSNNSADKQPSIPAASPTTTENTQTSDDNPKDPLFLTKE